jgi:hypothetical protein
VNSSSDEKAQELCAEARDEGPMCDHTCLLRDDHVEAGQPHFYGYRLGPGSLSHSLEEVQRLRAELARKDRALDEIRALHRETPCLCGPFGLPSGHPSCAVCADDGWPCATVRILSDLSEHQEEEK